MRGRLECMTPRHVWREGRDLCVCGSFSRAWTARVSAQLPAVAWVPDPDQERAKAAGQVEARPPRCGPGGERIP